MGCLNKMKNIMEKIKDSKEARWEFQKLKEYYSNVLYLMSRINVFLHYWVLPVNWLLFVSQN